MTDDGLTAGVDIISRTAQTAFGVRYLFPYQRLVIANVLEAARARKRAGAMADAGAAPPDEVDYRARQVVILPTGSGKSLCFQLPAVLLSALSVVVYPLLSLIADQKRKLDELGIEAEALTGRTTSGDLERIREGVESGSLRLLLTNPESLGSDRARKLLGGAPVDHLVIDEAHCVAEWGETFRPSYLELGGAVQQLQPRVVTGFTATASADVLSRVGSHLFGGADYHLIRGNPDRPNIRYSVVPAVSKLAALRMLLGGPSAPAVPATSELAPVSDTPLRPAVVFCSTRGQCERTALKLRRALNDSRIRFYHAGLSKEEKTELEEWFLKSEDGVLVATCAYGMGVDAPGIRAVIHRDLPPTVESYLQESGRAGRDGRSAQAVVLASPREMVGPGGTQGPAVAPAAATPGPEPGPLTRYLRGDCCRREILVEALGAEPEACSGCDVCDGVVRRESPIAARILRWLSRRRRRYTPGQAAAVLAGAARAAPVPWHPRREPVFGLLADWRREEIEEALDELRATGRLRVIKRGPWQGRMGSRTLHAHAEKRWPRVAKRRVV